MNQIDPNLQALLDQIAQFGFEFYGYDEKKSPLVKGPNGQITEINLAISFINEQMKKSSASAGSAGFEDAPEVNENIDATVSVERSSEVKLEQAAESSTETEKSPGQSQKDLQVQTKAPQITLTSPKTKPYKDGFDPTSFDPSNIQSTLKFVEKNSKLSNTSSNKWLAEQFKKFLKELKMGVYD